MINIQYFILLNITKQVLKIYYHIRRIKKEYTDYRNLLIICIPLSNLHLYTNII